MAPISEARRKANDKYIKNQDELKIRVPKGRKEEIQDYASAIGESLNGFVTTAIDERVERMKVNDAWAAQEGVTPNE